MSKSKKLRIAVLVVLLLIPWMFSTYVLMNARTFQLFGGLTNSVKTDEKLVALTFDDGPKPGATEEIVYILDRNEVKATFFLIGNSIDKNSQQAEELIQAGHQIGNHSYTHPRLIFKSPASIREEVDKTNDAIKNAGYKGEIMFRPPFGKKLVYLPYYVNKIGMKTIMWNIEPESYSDVAGNTDAIVRHVTDKVTPGSIILLHAMGDNQESRDSIEPIITALKAEGYKFVTVEQLLRAEKLSK